MGMGWRRRLEVWTDVLYEKYRSWDRCSETLVFLVIVITLRSEPSVRGGKFRSQLNLKWFYQSWGSLSGCFASCELLRGSSERWEIVKEWSFPPVSPGVQVVLSFSVRLIPSLHLHKNVCVIPGPWTPLGLSLAKPSVN